MRSLRNLLLVVICVMVAGMTVQAAKEPDLHTGEIYYHTPEEGSMSTSSIDDALLAVIDVKTGRSYTDKIAIAEGQLYAVSVHVELPAGETWQDARISAYLPPLRRDSLDYIGVTLSGAEDKAQFAAVELEVETGLALQLYGTPVVFSTGEAIELDPTAVFSDNGSPVGYQELNGEIAGGPENALEVVFYFTAQSASEALETPSQDSGPVRRALCTNESTGGITGTSVKLATNGAEPSTMNQTFKTVEVAKAAGALVILLIFCAILLINIVSENNLSNK